VLLAAGAELESAPARLGYTPLCSAASAGQHKVVQLLLAAGANVQAADANGCTPLHHAIKAEGFTAQGQRCKVVQQLLAAGADVEAANFFHENPLLKAAGSGQLDVVQVLLTAGANVEAATPNGITALNRAITLCDSNLKCLEMVQLLLGHGANPRGHFIGGDTTLSAAAGRSCVDTVQLMLEAWRQPDIPTADLVAAAKSAARVFHGPPRTKRRQLTFAKLAKELHTLYPAELQQLFVGVHAQRVPVAPANRAVLRARASDVSSLDEQQAAVRQRRRLWRPRRQQCSGWLCT
jgi:ankyrin repeat protein